MQNQIAADVAESVAKKLSERLLTIELAVERVKRQKEDEQPSRMGVRVSKLSEIDNKQFISNIIKEAWE